MFKLYTKRQMEDEVERRMWERDRERWIGERMDRIEKRVSKIEFQMKHGTDTLKVGEPVPVNGDCCCEPCPEEDF